MTRRPDLSADDGISLVEMMVAIVITAALGGVLVSSVVRTFQATAQATIRVDVLTSLERAHQRITRSVRAADPVISASATALEVVVHDSRQERRIIRYALSGDRLDQTVRTYTSPSSTTPATTVTTPVIDGLDQTGVTTFAYADAAGAPWDGVAATDIATVTITLQATTTSDVIPLTTTVFLRNSTRP